MLNRVYQTTINIETTGYNTGFASGGLPCKLGA